MKTKYENIYESYLKTDSDSDVINAFKKDLSSRKLYDKWSDFEMGMAEYAQKLSSEDELVECVRDFKSHMVNHIQGENDKILEFICDDSYAKGLLQEFERSITKFYDGLTPNDVNQIRSLINDAIIDRQYITFNYTLTLEGLLSQYYKHRRYLESTPIHVHGKIDGDVVLGIDNTEQLKDAPFSLTNKGRRAFIKPIFNDQFDHLRVDNAKAIIALSNIICVYGFSMGESDKTWTDLLANWLLENPEHHLVVYQYDEMKLNCCNYDEIMDIEESKKIELFCRLGINNETISNQIHIPVGRDIFDFKFVRTQPHRNPV